MKPLLLALFTVAAGSVAFDPYILHVEFTDGTTTALAASNATTCQAAISALWTGYWRLDKEIAKATCAPGNLFGADYAKGIR